MRGENIRMKTQKSVSEVNKVKSRQSKFIKVKVVEEKG